MKITKLHSMETKGTLAKAHMIFHALIQKARDYKVLWSHA
jgi:hypothetical protein